MLEKILKNIDIKENEILILFLNKKSLTFDEMFDIVLSSKLPIIDDYLNLLKQKHSGVVTDNSKNNMKHILKNTFTERLKNLVNKKYLSQVIVDDKEIYYSINNIFDLQFTLDQEQEITIRANLNSTKIFYNNTNETKIIKLVIKTKAELYTDSFLGGEVLLVVRNDDNYDEYNVIFVSKPYSYFEVLTNQKDKSFNNIKIDNQINELYKYYSMKISYEEIEPVKIYKEESKKDINLNSKVFKIKNTSEFDLFFYLFIGEIKKENIFQANTHIPPCSTLELDLQKVILQNNEEINLIFIHHNKYMIYNENMIRYRETISPNGTFNINFKD